FDADLDADLDVAEEFHTFGRHLRHAAVDVVLLHFEVGNAVAEQAADPIAFLKEHHRVAGAGKLLAAGEASGPRADDGDAPAGGRGRRLRFDPAFAPAAIDDLALDGFDGDGIIVDVQRA